MQHRSLIDGKPIDLPFLPHHSFLHTDQDVRLAQLTTSIDRQNNLSLQIGHELDLHQEILEDTDQAMGYTQRNLDRAAGRLRRVADGSRNHRTFNSHLASAPCPLVTFPREARPTKGGEEVDVSGERSMQRR